MNYFDRNKWWGVLILLLVTLNIATLSAFWLSRQKDPGGKNNPGRGSSAMEFLIRELGFDSSQKIKMNALKEDHQQKMHELRKGNEAAKDALFALLKQPGIADSAIESASKNSAFYDAQTDLINFRHFQQIRELCNDAQKKKFDAIIDEVVHMIGGPPTPPQPQSPPGPPGGKRPDGPPLPPDGPGPPPPPKQ